MPIDESIFIHEQDRVTLDALKAIPGFSALLKAFMKVWNERQFRIQNMSTNLRISEKMLPQYYNMLPPICEKIGIEVPEMYLELDVTPNAYTSGDTKPFIVITSGLIQHMPEELIPTVIAHECGHIACHHVLYHTMGQLILNNAASLLGISELVTIPLQMAFYHWMRCSEYSADRVAAVCDGTPDKIVEMCMRFAGLDKDMTGLFSKEAFLEQAVEYRDMLKNSLWDRTLEFLMYADNTHPLNAVRAYECDQWCRGEVFMKSNAYLLDESSARQGLLGTGMSRGDLPLGEGARDFHGRSVEEVEQKFRRIGFTHVTLERVKTKTGLLRSGQVISVSINGFENFPRNAWHAADAPVIIRYYEPPTQEEIAAEHPGQCCPPDTAMRMMGQQYTAVQQAFIDAGFTNITMEPQHGGGLTWLMKEGSVTRVTIDGRTNFDRSIWFSPEVPVRISYYTAYNMAGPKA